MIYLLHFDRPISPRHTTQHYVGFAEDVNARMALHRAGQGARLTQVAVARGIGFTVARTWPGGRDLERQIKRRKEAPALCPVCSGRAALSRCAETGAQLPLPLDADPWDDADDWPEPRPASRMDGYEAFMQRCWARSRPQVTPPDLSRLEGLL